MERQNLEVPDVEGWIILNRSSRNSKDGVDCNHMAQERDMWQAIANIVNCRFDKMWGVCWLAQILLASEERFHSMELSVSWSVGCLSLDIYFLFLVLLNKSCSFAHTNTEHSPCFPP
jgi:hypothetical protein